MIGILIFTCAFSIKAAELKIVLKNKTWLIVNKNIAKNSYSATSDKKVYYFFKNHESSIVDKKTIKQKSKFIKLPGGILMEEGL